MPYVLRNQLAASQPNWQNQGFASEETYNRFGQIMNDIKNYQNTYGSTSGQEQTASNIGMAARIRELNNFFNQYEGAGANRRLAANRESVLQNNPEAARYLGVYNAMNPNQSPWKVDKIAPQAMAYFQATNPYNQAAPRAVTPQPTYYGNVRNQLTNPSDPNFNRLNSLLYNYRSGTLTRDMPGYYLANNYLNSIGGNNTISNRPFNFGGTHGVSPGQQWSGQNSYYGIQHRPTFSGHRLIR